ncbi:hypothetical protein B566_EDAN013069 [Ephemera danica]|nr:hypothetical protein B566_EDAN013069 [Ephemera danica]
MTLELRPLNSIIIQENHPLPQCIYFVLDIKDAFFNIPLHEAHKEKTAFAVQSGKYAGHWEYNYMTMGLKNANNLLRGLSLLQTCNFFDDCIIFKKTFKETITRLEQILTRFRTANLTLTSQKAQLAVKKCSYLGRVQKRGEEKVIACASRKLSKTEQNMSTTMREFLALVWGTQRFRYYLKFQPKFTPLPNTSKPFDRDGLDITKLPKFSHGFQYILTIICHFSRYLVMIPLEDQTTEAISKALVEQFIPIHGVPISIISDCGQSFLSK